MKIFNIVSEILKSKQINIPTDDNSDGLKMQLNNEELLIHGSSSDLLELSNYLINIALSNTKGTHLHIDEQSLLSSDSQLKNIIIIKD